MENRIEDFTKKQLYNVFEYVDGIIDSLSDKALEDLLGGYKNDVNFLIDEMARQTNLVINNNATKVNLENVGYPKELEYALDQQLKKFSLNYFTANVLSNFEVSWRTLEWGNLMQLNPLSGYLCQRGSGKSYFFCYATPLWRLYSYDPPRYLVRNTRDNVNRKETVIITNESRLGILHVSKITEELKTNDILADKLNIKRKDLGREGITTDTGSILHLRTYGSFIRGLHVGHVAVDDFLDKSALYSATQRSKFEEVFYAEIMNIVEPGGNLVVSGTPFHEKDLYNTLKNDKNFKVFEYPGIFPDGRLLAPDRFSYKYLMEMRRSLGSLLFSREILVTPVSDGSSLFPWDFLNRSLIGMENIGYVDNIESYPIKMKKVIVSCDFAISGAIGADYSVFGAIGLDFSDQYHLMYYWREKGASHNTQVNKIVSMNHAFRPNKIICENNGFQRVIVSLARQRGLKNIEEFTTGSNKKDDYSGLPSLSALFERGEIKMPARETDGSLDKTMIVLGELNSITYNEDKGTLESADQHDDTAMMLWIGVNDLRTNKITPSIYYV